MTNVARGHSDGRIYDAQKMTALKFRRVPDTRKLADELLGNSLMRKLGYRGDLHRPGADLQIIPTNGLEIAIARPEFLAAARNPSKNADKLFAALDGSEVRTFGYRFDLEVYSVTDQSTGRWVQLGLRGVREHMVTLRLPLRSGLSEATMALSEWLADPFHTVGTPAFV